MRQTMRISAAIALGLVIGLIALAVIGTFQ